MAAIDSSAIPIPWPASWAKVNPGRTTAMIPDPRPWGPVALPTLARDGEE